MRSFISRLVWLQLVACTAGSGAPATPVPDATASPSDRDAARTDAQAPDRATSDATPTADAVTPAAPGADAATPTPAPRGWLWQNPFPAGGRLNAIAFADARTGVVVGDSGQILRTTDGGMRWTHVPLPVQVRNLHDVAFTSATTGFAVGEGIILRTNDGGASWTLRPSPTNQQLRHVHFPTASVGYVTAEGLSIPSQIFKTVDGGQSWSTPHTTPQSDRETTAIFFTSADVGYLTTVAGQIFQTVDGGETWSRQESGTTISLDALFFIDAQVGFATGGPVLLKTVDGGKTWTRKNAPSGGRAVRFVDARVGYVMTGTGVLATADSGETWTVLPGVKSAAFDFWLLDARTLVAVGQYGQIAKSTDGARTWSYQSDTITRDSLYGVHFLDAQTGFALGAPSTILRTTDGGRAWKVVSRFDPAGGPTQAPMAVLKAAAFRTRDSGFAIGAKGAILRTTDGGETWVRRPDVGQWDLHAIQFPTPDIGYIAGENGQIYKTVDGGERWVAQTTHSSSNLVTLAFIDANRGFAAGTWLLGTSDGGATWRQVMTGTAISSLQFFDARIGHAIGSSQVHRTTDGGATWQSMPLASGPSLAVYAFVDPQRGYAIGSRVAGCAVMATTDGGRTWTTEKLFGSYLYALSYPRAGAVYAVGGFGEIVGWVE